jgi:hypothetical protein
MGMGFQANVLKVMIASPSDVADEREIVTNVLYQWNNANAVTRELVLQPVKWETHSSPQMGAPAQSLLNEHLLLDADIVVGIFGTRVGTATTDFISGSVEEIKRHVATGKLAMLYFSHVPVDPHAIDPKQWAALQTFKEECRTGGLYAEYASHEQLRTDFGHHLAIALNRPQYLWLTKPNAEVELKEPDLDHNERRLILETADDRNGQIIAGSTMGGFYVQANGKNFVEDTPRSSAVWKRVLSNLVGLGYLHQESEEIYELTEDGYARADKETSLAPLELSLSFAGTPNRQLLSVESNKPIIVKQVEFLTSSEAKISDMQIDSEIGKEHSVVLDHTKIISLFNTPRSDRNYSDHSGPAMLRLVLEVNGRRNEVQLPIMLQPKIVGNTQWIELSGSKVFVLEDA